MATLPAKFPCTIKIIVRVAPLVLLVIAGHGGWYKIFGIWNNRLLSNPLWKLICGLLVWIPTRATYFWPVVTLFMALIVKLVTINIWLDRWTSSISTTISTAAALESRLIKSLVNWILNVHSACLRKLRLVLRLLLVCSRFPPLWTGNIKVLTCTLLYNGIIGDDLLWYMTSMSQKRSFLINSVTSLYF